MKVLIYGTGVMGKGIAQLIASKGIKTFLYNSNYDRALLAYDRLQLDLKKLYDKGKISEDNLNEILSNIEVIKTIDSAFDVNFVIETVPENIEIKKEVFKLIDSKINKEAIFVTNTSSLSISEMSLVTSRPEKVIGLHFFNPAPIMHLVEIVKGQFTSDFTVKEIRDLSDLLEKESIIINETPGFVVNRILIPFINDAIGVLNEGIASAGDIDKAIKLGANHPIGPLALADLIGLDVCLNIMNTLYSNIGEEKYKPNALLEEMVSKNLLGRKTKVGFFSY